MDLQSSAENVREDSRAREVAKVDFAGDQVARNGLIAADGWKRFSIQCALIFALEVG